MLRKYKCVFCRKPFEAHKYKQFCSPLCTTKMWQAEHPDYRRVARDRRFAKMFEKQDGKCAGCGRREDEAGRLIERQGKVLTCFKCRRVVGGVPAPREVVERPFG